MSAFSQSVGHARLAPIIISIRAVRVNIIPATTTTSAAEKQKENRVVAFAFGPGTAADVHSAMEKRSRSECKDEIDFNLDEP